MSNMDICAINVADLVVCQFDLSKLNTHSSRVDFDRLEGFNQLHLIRQINDEAKLPELVGQVRHMIEQW